MKKKLVIILTVLALLYLIGKGCSNTSPTPSENNLTDENSSQEPVKEESVKLPENKFDATVAAPGTNLLFGYPSKGFYQLGARITTYQPGDPQGYGNVLTIQTEQAYNAEKGSEFVNLIVALDEGTTTEKTLKNVIDKRNFNALDIDYVKDNGNYLTINGREFFVYQVDDLITMWKALTLHNNQVITVTMMYKEAGGDESKAAFQYNDTLFLDILKNISSK